MDRILEILIENGLAEDAAQRMAKYAALMLERNKVLNLTRITEPEQVAKDHILDSLCFAGLIDEGARVLDVGTGAGFPGVPLAIMRPDINVVLMDSVEKKLVFVREAIADVGIENASVLNARAEEAGQTNLRAGFDVVVSRAVASLPVLCELCLPFVKIGGKFIAYKGAAAAQELAEAQGAIKTLGGAGAELVASGAQESEHCAVVVIKAAATPKSYPRRFAAIKKQPL